MQFNLFKKKSKIRICINIKSGIRTGSASNHSESATLGPRDSTRTAIAKEKATSPAGLKLRPVAGYTANYKEMATSTA